MKTGSRHLTPGKVGSYCIMTYDDTKFYIDNRRVGSKVTIGPQSGADYFHQIKEHLIGDCTIEFRVGELGPVVNSRRRERRAAFRPVSQ